MLNKEKLEESFRLEAMHTIYTSHLEALAEIERLKWKPEIEDEI